MRGDEPEWSIGEVSTISGMTTRALRHYGRVGLLDPVRTGPGGVRFYDERALARLQRIMLLRELGLSLAAISQALAGEQDAAGALRAHLVLLEQELDRTRRRIDSVRRTITSMEAGEPLMAQSMFDGFDHTSHRSEVEQRWGRQAYADSDRWWGALSADQRRERQSVMDRLAADWRDAGAGGAAPDGDLAQDLARRQVRWLSDVPGLPVDADGRPSGDYLTGLGEMYVADERFASVYGGLPGAELVRDALRVYVERRPAPGVDRGR